MGVGGGLSLRFLLDDPLSKRFLLVRGQPLLRFVGNCSWLSSVDPCTKSGLRELVCCRSRPYRTIGSVLVIVDGLFNSPLKISLIR